jgi:predicted nucleic acid-binding protein
MTRSETPALVIDASVAIAICLEEPLAGEADQIIRTRRAAGARLLVPTFFWLEVVNVLAVRYRLAPGRVLEAVATLDGMGLETVEFDRPQLLLALDIMARTGGTAYDAGYVALAEWADAQLLTADQRMASAAGSRAVPTSGRQTVRERASPYAATWAEWPGAAAYLQQLRTQVLRQSTG